MVAERKGAGTPASCDVLVVGAGGAGLSAAVSAAEASASVVVLEQLSTLRGTTSYSVGSFAAAGTRLQRAAGISDSAADFAEDISLTHPLANRPDHLRIMLADESGPVLAWLEKLGVVFVGPYPEPPNRVPRMHNAVPNGRAYLDVLSRAAARLGVRVLYDAKAESLIVEDGRVVGVAFVRQGVRQEIRARRGVVLASGDFTGSQEMRDRHLPPAAAGAVPVNTGNKGDGHRMAIDAGAEMRNMDVIFGPQLRLPPDGRVSWIDRLPRWRWMRRLGATMLTSFPRLLGPMVRGLMVSTMSPSAELFDEGAVLVSSQGALMGAGSGGRINDLAATADGNGYVVGDRRLADKFGAYPYFVSTAPGIAYAYFQHYEKARPELLRWFDDIPAMARHYGMEAAALAAAAGGLKAPYFAFGPFKAMVTVSEGGAATDAAMRVLDGAGVPVEGLFAAGAVGQGGLRLKGHGLHIGWAIVSGRVAGQAAAGTRPLAPVAGRTEALDMMTSRSPERMKRSKVTTLEDAVALVRDGATLAVCGAGGVQEPDLLLQGLVERFERTGSPAGLTEFHPIRTGEVDGRGTSVFGRRGFVRRMIGGSFWPVGSVELTRLINANEMEAYNYPIGILYGLLEAVAGGRPGIVTRIGMGTYVDPAQGGGALNEISKDILVSRIEIGGESYLFYRAVPVDVAFIRGTTADEDGNLTMEDEPAVCGPLILAQAARSSGGKVVAQVRRIVPRGTLDPHMVRVPGILVDAIVQHDDQQQTTRHRYQPSAVGRERLDPASIPPRPLDESKVVLRRALMQARPGETIALGFGLPGYLPAIALEEGVFDDLTFTIEHGPIGGINGLAAGGSTFPMSHNPQAILDASDQLRLYAGGGIDRAYLGIGELDGNGNVNVGQFGDRIPGTGGFIEITQGFRNVVFCCVLGDKGRRKLVDAVQQVSFNGAQAYRAGQSISYVTEKGVFGLGPDGLVLEEIAPGLDVRRDILEQVGARVAVSPALRTMPASLFGHEPMNLAAAWNGSDDLRRASGF